MAVCPAMNDTTPIINRAIEALPTKEHTQKLLWVRLHKLSEKVDIITKLHVRQQEEIHALTIELLKFKIRAARKPSYYFVLSIVVCLLVMACATTAIFCLATPAKPFTPQESK